MTLSISVLIVLSPAKAIIELLCGPRRADAAIEVTEVANKLLGAPFPGMPERKVAAGLARHAQCAHAGFTQVVAQHADRIAADDVTRPSHGECRDRYAACERLELYHAESVREAWEYEYVRCCDVRRERLAVQRAQKSHLGIAAPQFTFLRALADNDFRTRQLERQERVEILLDRNAPNADENRPRKVELDVMARAEHLGVDAARPHAEIGEAALGQLTHQ